MEQVFAFVQSFLVNIGAPLIGILIGLDVLLGVASAVKQGKFQWSKVWQFYRTMVIPYLISYVGIQVAIVLVPDLPDALDFIIAGLPGVAFAAIVGTLTTSVIGHIKEIGLQKNA